MGESTALPLHRGWKSASFFEAYPMGVDSLTMFNHHLKSRESAIPIFYILQYSLWWQIRVGFGSLSYLLFRWYLYPFLLRLLWKSKLSILQLLLSHLSPVFSSISIAPFLWPAISTLFSSFSPLKTPLESWFSAKAVKPFPTMYCNEIKRRNFLQRPKKLMEMLAPLDNTSMDAFKNYVLPIWKAGNVPFTDSRCIGWGKQWISKLVAM